MKLAKKTLHKFNKVNSLIRLWKIRDGTNKALKISFQSKPVTSKYIRAGINEAKQLSLGEIALHEHTAIHMSGNGTNINEYQIPKSGRKLHCKVILEPETRKSNWKQ